MATWRVYLGILKTSHLSEHTDFPPPCPSLCLLQSFSVNDTTIIYPVTKAEFQRTLLILPLPHIPYRSNPHGISTSISLVQTTSAKSPQPPSICTHLSNPCLPCSPWTRWWWFLSKSFNDFPMLSIITLACEPLCLLSTMYQNTFNLTYSLLSSEGLFLILNITRTPSPANLSPNSEPLYLPCPCPTGRPLPQLLQGLTHCHPSTHLNVTSSE